MITRTDWIKYCEHKRGGRSRRIKFKLTFEEWMSIWLASGHYHERGRRKGQYVMARLGDKGPYSVNNVKIVTVTENHSEVDRKVRSRNAQGNKGFSGRHHTDATRAKMRLAKLKGTGRLNPAPSNI